MTKEECVIVMAATGVCTLKGDDLNLFYKYISELMGRPIYSHEIAYLSEEIREKSKKDFIRLCENAR